MTTLRFPEERTVEEGARYHFKFAQCIYSNRDLQQEGNARQGSKQSPLHARRRFGGRRSCCLRMPMLAAGARTMRRRGVSTGFTRISEGWRERLAEQARRPGTAQALMA